MPSLSRAPDFVTKRKIEDGTLSDPKESGYVSTRPRFTRIRRSWTVGWKNLLAEDVRALDRFEVYTVKGGAGSFYMPNLLQNGSFEFHEGGSGSNPLTFDGWTRGSSPEEILQLSAGSDPSVGGVAAQFSIVRGYSLASGVSAFNGYIFNHTSPIPVSSGDSMQFSGSVSVVVDSVPAGLQFTTQAILSFDVGGQIYTSPVTAATSGFVPYSYQFTVPAGASVLTLSLFTYLSQSTGSPIVLAGTLAVSWDECGLAVSSAAQAFGRMPGTSSPGSALRLTKPIEIKDGKLAVGVKRYDATCEVTEL